MKKEFQGNHKNSQKNFGKEFKDNKRKYKFVKNVNINFIDFSNIWCYIINI